MFSYLPLSCLLGTINHSRAMQGRRQKSKGTTSCPYCSCAVNNFHISRHIASQHTNSQHTQDIFGDHRLTPPPNTPPNNDAPVRDDAQNLVHLGTNVSLSGDEYNDDQSSGVITDDETDSNIQEESDDEDDENDEAEKTVEDYLRDLTDETYRTEIQYDPKRVLKYLSWTKRPLTEIELQTIRFLRCASFGNGLSKAHANEWLAYERELGGRAGLLPKNIGTLWSTMAKAHRSMSDAICHRTLEIDIPLEVHKYLLPNLIHPKKWSLKMIIVFDHF